MENNAKLKFRLSIQEDKDEIISLLNSVFGKQQRGEYIRDIDYFNWKYLNSSFGKSITTVCECDGQIVGIDNLWPWRLTYNGNVLTAYQACDSVVDEKYRGNRILQRMRSHGVEKAKERNADLLFNFPNEQSLKTNLNFGYTFLTKLNWWVKVIDPVKAIGIVSNKTAKATNSEYNFTIDTKRLATISAKYDYRDKITIDRSEEYFEYRYNMHPNRKYASVFFEDIAAVYTINLNKGYKEMAVTEIIGDKTKLNKLLKRIHREARQLKCAYIAIVRDNNIVNNKMLFNLYIPVKFKNMVVLPLKDELKNVITDYNSWSLSASLHDSI